MKICLCNAKNKQFSSNINEAIRAFLNSYFFYKKISHAPKARKTPKNTKSTKKHKNHQKTPKSTKKHQKEQRRNQAKAQNANKRTKIKNVFKNI